MRTNTYLIGNILPRVLRQAGISKNKEAGLNLLIKEWPGIIGVSIAQQTNPLNIKQNVLQVTAKSPALLYELTNFQKEQILQKIQIRYPEQKIRDIVFVIEKEHNTKN